MNLIVQIRLQNQDPNKIIASARLICRNLQNFNHCSSFTLVNRANEGRVDCYFFDFTSSLSNLNQQFSIFKINKGDIQELAKSPDLSLVKMAGLTVEILLTEYKIEQRENKLFGEHMHYILNGIGHGYKEEIDFYLNATRNVVHHVMH